MSTSEPTLLRLRFLGQPMGSLAYNSELNAFAFECDSAWLAQGHDVSPVRLPLEGLRERRLFRAGDSPFAGGLPGLIADSLPDAWGEKMLRAEMPGLRTVIGKLAAIGQRGPGAITFEPAIGKGTDGTAVAHLATIAHEAVRLAAVSGPAALRPSQVDRALAYGGSSLGGAYPKVSANLPLTGSQLELQEITVGGVPPAGHVPCILKFSPANGEGGGGVEYAFMQMAAAAGIPVPRTALVSDGERQHFAVERFDRVMQAEGSVSRRHVHTLSGMLHRRASDTTDPLDYEDYMRLSRRLVGAGGAADCFRRAVFNVLATNRDDHGRNHAFLYDVESRTWDLAPAYDLNPSVANNLIGLTWLGTSERPRRFETLLKLAEIGGISSRRARDICDQVEEAVFSVWPIEAQRAGVPKDTRDAWLANIQQQGSDLRADLQRLRRPKAKHSASPRR